ncbi:hypothetical protein BDN72DRAFT_793607 [Pluteus cervinus]|uniref:Uncharacterized protein n=1 Tax=Pluteus cervinus TaxID=181527 RepID=A0ACD3B188_9AGAR|nr:hypothetical protein BDN72DRAFT_793607 [Pluteus cervinus]
MPSATKQICSFYQRGACTRGIECNFSHDLPTNAPSSATAPGSSQRSQREHPQRVQEKRLIPCTFHAKGDCKRGQECHFSHDLNDHDQQESLDSSIPGTTQLSRTSHEITCKYFEQGNCRRGESCIFKHIQSDPHVTIEVEQPTIPSALRPELQAAPEGTVEQERGPLEEETRHPFQDEAHEEDIDNGSDSQEAWPEQTQIEPYNLTPKSTTLDHRDISPGFEPPEVDHGRTGSDSTHNSPVPSTRPEIGWADTAGANVVPEPHWSEYADPTASPLTPFCKFLAQGRCTRASACRFRHSLTVHDYFILFLNPNPPLWSHGAGEELPGTTVKNPKISTSSFGPCKFYPLGRCKNGETCPYSHIQEHMRENGAEEVNMEAAGDNGWGDNWDEQGPATWATESSAQRDSRPREEHNGWHVQPQEDTKFPTQSRSQFERRHGVCYQYQEGRCYRGDSCRFLHEDPTLFTNPQASATENPLEGNTSTEAEQTWGESWPDPDPPHPQSPRWWDSVDLCRDFQHGLCLRGDRCKYRHETTEDDEELEHVGDNVTAAEMPDSDVQASWNVSWDPIPDPLASAPPSGNQSTDVCRFFLRGDCWKGDQCLRPHTLPSDSDRDEVQVPSESPHRSTSGSGAPTQTSEHRAQTPVSDGGWGAESWATESTTSLGRPTKVKQPCLAYGQGYCLMGDACKFLHIDPDAPRVEANQTPDLPVTSRASSPQPYDVSQDPLVERELYCCTTVYGPGCFPQQIQTDFESNVLHILKLPPHMARLDVISLVGEFGDPTDVIIRHLPSGDAASIEFSGHQQAVDALASLSITRPSLRPMRCSYAFIDRHAEEPTPSDCHIRVSWPAPSTWAWCHYATITAAKAEATRLNGFFFSGRKAKTTYHPPRKGQTHSFAVQVTDLPIDTTKEEVEISCNSATLVSIGNPAIVESPFDAIRDLFTAHGTIASFDVVTPNIADSRHVMFIRYQTPQEAFQAVSQMHRVQSPLLGDARFKVERVHYAHFRVPIRRFNPVQEDIKRLQQDHLETCTIQFTQTEESALVWVHAQPDQFRVFAQVAHTMRQAFRGILMLQNGKPFWDPYFDLPKSTQVVDRLNKTPQFFALCDTRCQQIRVIGTTEGRKAGEEAILRMLQKVQSMQHGIPVPTAVIHSLLHGGLKPLWDDVGEVKVVLDIPSQQLIVRGDQATLQKARSAVDSALDTVISPDDDLACRICFCRAIQAVELSCRHIYCMACLQYALRSSIGAHFSPLHCFGQDASSGERCGTPIPFLLTQELLTLADIEALLFTSFMSAARTWRSELQFCPTYGCEVLFRMGQTATATPIRCPLCATELCPFCLDFAHEGIRCFQPAN